jgi:hypothetical protein
MNDDAWNHEREDYTVALRTFSVICNFLRTDLEEQHCIFCFKCGKIASKMNETLETNVSGSVMERTRLLSGFLAVNLAKIKLKIVSILIVPQQVTEMKT